MTKKTKKPRKPMSQEHKDKISKAHKKIWDDFKKECEDGTYINNPDVTTIKNYKNTLYCSFCEKSQHEVEKLISGSSALICNKCIHLAMNIINETAFKST